MNISKEDLIIAGFVPTEYEGQKGVFYVKKTPLASLPAASQLIDEMEFDGDSEVITETIPEEEMLGGAVQMHIPDFDYIEGPFPLNSEQAQILLADAIKANKGEA